MYKIQNSLKLMGLALLFWAAMPAGSNAAKEEVELHADMLACVQGCTKQLNTCINACPDNPNKAAVLTCFTKCSATTPPTPSFAACYSKCAYAHS